MTAEYRKETRSVQKVARKKKGAWIERRKGQALKGWKIYFVGVRGSVQDRDAACRRLVKATKFLIKNYPWSRMKEPGEAEKVRKPCRKAALGIEKWA